MNIPTAKEFLELNYIGNTPDVMIEFAKLHCEEQNKVIREKVKYDGADCNTLDIIETAYPLENIK